MGKDSYCIVFLFRARAVADVEYSPAASVLEDKLLRDFVEKPGMGKGWGHGVTMLNNIVVEEKSLTSFPAGTKSRLLLSSPTLFTLPARVV